MTKLPNPKGLNVLYEQVFDIIRRPGDVPFNYQISENPENQVTYLVETVTYSLGAGCVVGSFAGQRRYEYRTATNEYCSTYTGFTHRTPGFSRRNSFFPKYQAALSLTGRLSRSNTIRYRYGNREKGKYFDRKLTKTLSSQFTSAGFRQFAQAQATPFRGVYSRATSYPRNLYATLFLARYTNDIYHRKFKFKFKWGDQVKAADRHPVQYHVLFAPRSDGDPSNGDERKNVKVITSLPIKWDGQASESPHPVTIDPLAIDKTKDGAYRLIKVDLKKVDRDDPSKTWTSSVAYNPGDPIYAGQSNGDMVRWRITLDSWGRQGITFAWSAEHPDGTVILGPSGKNKYEWIMANISPSNALTKWIDWKPGTWKIKCYINKSPIEFEQEVGVRSDSVLAIAWIDPKKVLLNTAGVQQSLLDVFKPDGLSETSDNDKLRAALLAKHISENGVNARFQIDLGLLIIGRNFKAFTSADKTYALNWMFKHAGNAPPLGSFQKDGHFSQSLLDNFIAEKGGSRFKLLNHYQVKYLVDKQKKFKPESIVYLKKKVIIGKTRDPARVNEARGLLDTIGRWLNNYPSGGLFPGLPGANNSLTPVETTIESKLCNEGRPDRKALDAFKNLTGHEQGEIWSSITFFSDKTHFSSGSLTRQPKPTKIHQGRINTQVYPTYWIYINGATMSGWKQQQAPQPSALFPNTDRCQ